MQTKHNQPMRKLKQQQSIPRDHCLWCSQNHPQVKQHQSWKQTQLELHQQHYPKFHTPMTPHKHFFNKKNLRTKTKHQQNSCKKTKARRQYQMVQPSWAGASNIHPGPFPHRVQAFKHLHVSNNPLKKTCHFQTIFNKAIH